MKKHFLFVILLLVLSLIVGCSGKTAVQHTDADVIEQINNLKPIAEYDKTDELTIDSLPIVYFGQYYQNDISGRKKEDIEWILLKKDKDEAILCSKYIIDRKMFEESGSVFDYKDSTLCKWLNTDFYNIAFETESIIKNNKGNKISLLDDRFVMSLPSYTYKYWVETNATSYANRYFERITKKEDNYIINTEGMFIDGKKDVNYLRINRKDINWYGKGFSTRYVCRDLANESDDGYIYIREGNGDTSPVIQNHYWSIDNFSEKNLTGVDGWMGLDNQGYLNFGSYTVYKDKEEAKIDKSLNGVRPLIKVDLNIKEQTSHINTKLTKEYDVKEIVRNILTIDRYNNDAFIDSIRTVKFGKYKVNGKDEDLTWIVLYRDGNKALLLSQYAIEKMKYAYKDSDYRTYHKWQYSQVRDWLNNEFYNKTFTEYEKKLIHNTELKNDIDVEDAIVPMSNGSLGYVYQGIEYDEPTYDKVFVLSKEEIINYFKYDAIGIKHNDDGTTFFDYTPNSRFSSINKLGTQMITDKNNTKHVAYWTRSRQVHKITSNSPDYIAYEDNFVVNGDDYCGDRVYLVAGSNEFAVRPAIWIEYNNVYRVPGINAYSFYINDVLQTNTWVEYLDDRYYVDGNGIPVKNQFVDDSYLGSDGKMVRNMFMDDGTYIDYYGRKIDIDNDLEQMIKTEEIEENTWHKTEGGLWYYFEKDRSNPKKGWYIEEKDNQTYYLDEQTGIMATGWRQINGDWYYFNEQPAIIPNWYYIEAKDVWDSYGNDIKSYGSMFRDEITPDGRRVDGNGKLIK